MQYIFDGRFYKITRITGPKHNMLAIKFSDSNNTICVVDLDSSGKAPNILAAEVKSQVQLGLDEINRELGTCYKISTIQFVSSDSASDTIYTELVKHIVKKLETGGSFTRV